MESLPASSSLIWSARDTIYANDHKLDIKGANWFGLEGPGAVLGGLNVRPLDSLLDFLSSNKFNAIRLPLCVHNVLADVMPGQWGLSEVHNPELRNLSFLRVLDELVARAATRGLLILLDMHLLNTSRADGGFVSKLWYDEQIPEELVASAWRTLARRYCSAFNILGADVFVCAHTLPPSLALAATYAALAANDAAHPHRRVVPSSHNLSHAPAQCSLTRPPHKRVCVRGRTSRLPPRGVATARLSPSGDAALVCSATPSSRAARAGSSL